VRYIYMHNFRGFNDTLIPLSQLTFLVGENSTGKSSFLKLLYLLSHPHFWFSPEFTLNEDSDLGGFHDIVSAWAADKSYFQVGILMTRDNKKGGLDARFAVHTFVEKDGGPELSRYLYFVDKKIMTLIFSRQETRYKTVEVQRDFSSEKEILDYFQDILASDREDTNGHKQFPKDIPPKPPLPVAVAILRSIEQGKKITGHEFHTEIPFAGDLTWIAPIRTKPRRFYDGLPRSFSPEGDHTPFVLRRSLEIRTKSSQFVQKLKAFGQASGLFETVVAHSFGKSPQAPFEILIKFSGAELNINNVGYGVSQVLPLIVEFLSQERNRTFAVQQPEVHLHPRAQAALGELIYELAKERNHSFVLETHSDYLIDRFRLEMHADEDPPKAQVVFFQRIEDGNHANIIPISPEGRYPKDQPKAFRDFFIKEEMALLEI
jgi:AAA ATPase domain